MADRGGIDQADLDEVRARVRLDDLVGETVALRRAGAGQMKGLCPFHGEKTPSFTVTPSRGFFYCFGCGKGGDIFDWVMWRHGLTFPDAARWLADRAGLQLRDTGRAEPTGPSRRRILDTLTAAQGWYAAQLATPEAAAARRDLSARGFTQEHATRHGCGYAPRTGGVDAAVGGFSRDEVKAAGLRREHGGDFFTGRLMWPLADATGRVVGFAGRRLYDDDRHDSKYINSPTGPVFNKSELLYWLHQAKRPAETTGRVLIVEGYTDVMACDAAGVGEVVASCGTAFGEAHLRLLRRTLPDAKIVFCFDADPAGIAATRKAWQLAKDDLGHCWTVRLPAGMDPCDLRARDGDDALRAALATPRPLTEVVLEDTIAAALVDDTAESRTLAVDAAVTVLGGIPDAVLRDGYVPVAAALLRVPAGHLAQRLDPTRPAAPVTTRTTPSGAVGVSPERLVLTLIVNHPDLVDVWLPHLSPDLFATQAGREISTQVLTTPISDRWAHQLVDSSPDSTRDLLIGMLTHHPEPDDADSLRAGLRRLRIDAATRHIATLRGRLATATDPDEIATLSAQWATTNSDLKALKADRN